MDTKTTLPEPNYAFYTGAARVGTRFFAVELYAKGIIDKKQMELIAAHIEESMARIEAQAIEYGAIHPNR